MTGLRRRLDAQQRPDATDRQSLHEWLQLSVIEYLLGVGADVLRRQTHSRALADAVAIVGAILEVTQLRGRSELRAMLVSDVRIREQGLQATGVGPRVPRASHSPPLTDINYSSDRGPVERTDETGGVELVNTDGRDL